MIVPFEPQRRIVLAGGSGPVGRALARGLQELGVQVTVLTRSPYAAPYETVHWDGERPGLWTESLEGADGCLLLAGPKLDGRPSRENQQKVYRARLHTLRLMNEAIGGLRRPPRTWMLASTADIYRHAADRTMDEATGELGGWEKISKLRRAPARWNFAATLARECEEAFLAAELPPEVRRVALRMGLAMSTEAGSAFTRLSHRVWSSLGGRVGNGRQWVSWIHERDLARAVLFLLGQEQIDGPVNVTAPMPVRNRALMAALREAWGIPNGFPAPWPLVELRERLWGAAEGSELKSRCVVPARLLEAGFAFEFAEWEGAAEELVRRAGTRD